MSHWRRQVRGNVYVRYDASYILVPIRGSYCNAWVRIRRGGKKIFAGAIFRIIRMGQVREYENNKEDEQVLRKVSLFNNANLEKW